MQRSRWGRERASASYSRVYRATAPIRSDMLRYVDEALARANGLVHWYESVPRLQFSWHWSRPALSLAFVVFNGVGKVWHEFWVPSSDRMQRKERTVVVRAVRQSCVRETTCRCLRLLRLEDLGVDLL